MHSAQYWRRSCQGLKGAEDLSSLTCSVSAPLNIYIKRSSEPGVEYRIIAGEGREYIRLERLEKDNLLAKYFFHLARYKKRKENFQRGYLTYAVIVQTGFKLA